LLLELGAFVSTRFPGPRFGPSDDDVEHARKLGPAVSSYMFDEIAKILKCHPRLLQGQLRLRSPS
jgi:hypothetical protein